MHHHVLGERTFSKVKAKGQAVQKVDAERGGRMDWTEFITCPSNAVSYKTVDR